mgnify:CR=1 FL=1
MGAQILAAQKSVISRVLKLLIFVSVFCGIWQLGAAGKIYAKAWLAQQLLESAWQATLNGEQNVRPWPWADTWPIAVLAVPRLGIRQIVLNGDSGRVLAFAPGYTEASTVPGGQGITVISGHRDTSFSFLKDIQHGDIIELKTLAGTFNYTVSERAVVDQRQFIVDTQMTEPRLMLVTCYPFDALEPGGDERFVVVARMTEGELQRENEE